MIYLPGSAGDRGDTHELHHAQGHDHRDAGLSAAAVANERNSICVSLRGSRFSASLYVCLPQPFQPRWRRTLRSDRRRPRHFPPRGRGSRSIRDGCSTGAAKCNTSCNIVRAGRCCSRRSIAGGCGGEWPPTSAASVFPGRGAARSDAPLIRRKHGVSEGPGSAAHHYVLRCARETAQRHSRTSTKCPATAAAAAIAGVTRWVRPL